MTVSEDFQLGADFARALDAGDPLARFRGRFAALSGRIYLQANGLGLASREAEAAVEAALAAWKQRAHRGWEEGEQPWLTAERLGALQAPLVGAAADEVVATGTTTQNLHVLLATFYRPAGRRTKILADELNFPSDVFALQSQVRLRGLDPAEHLVLVKSRDGRMLEEDDVVAAMTDEITVLVLPSAIYRSAQVLDVARLTRAAHERGILAGFDLSHSIGITPHALDRWDVDFAFWCGYKWLNGGPGAVGGLYVNRRHFGRRAGMTGWFGVAPARQFDPDLVYEQAPTARAWCLSTPHVLSAAALEGALGVFHEASGAPTASAARRSSSSSTTPTCRSDSARASWCWHAAACWPPARPTPSRAIRAWSRPTSVAEPLLNVRGLAAGYGPLGSSTASTWMSAGATCWRSWAPMAPASRRS